MSIDSSSVYYLPSLPKIVIKSLDKVTTYYTFDPFTYGANPGGVTYCSLSLGTNQHGSFEVEFEDINKTIDDTLITSPARCYIYFGKSIGNFNLMLSGMIRQSGYTRGCENNLLYSVSGFGTGVRTNERILDANETPTKLEFDGVTIDTTDSDFFARDVVDDSLDDQGYYPQNITGDIVEGTGGYAHINTSSTQTDSPIKDFIPGVVSRFQEISDVHNQVEDYTGGRVYVDTSDKIQLQPLMTPLSSNSGFIITTTQDTANDLAANTMYVMADYDFSNSIQKDAGYSSGMYGILQSEPAPDVDYFQDDTYYWENYAVEIAQKFRPPTNPNWRIFCAVEGIGFNNTVADNSVRGRWRIAEDNAGQPGDVIANKFMYPNSFYNTGESGMQTIQVMGLGNTDLDVNENYWLILSSTNATAPIHWRWYIFRLASARGESMTAAPGTSTDTDATGTWTATPGYRQQFLMTRFKAEPFGIFDEKAINKRIMIESVAQGFPQQITSKLAASKYLVGLMQYAARPKRVFQFPAVTVPNNPVFPGDIAYIVDSRFNFSTSGNPVVCGTITDLQYSFGVKNAGLSSSSRGMGELALNVVSYNQFY